MKAYSKNPLLHTYENVQNVIGSGGIRTHASEETGALNQRLRPLGHATHSFVGGDSLKIENDIYPSQADDLFDTQILFNVS